MADIKTEVKNKFTIVEELRLTEDSAKTIQEFVSVFNPDFPINWTKKNKILLDIHFDKKTNVQQVTITCSDEEVKLIPSKKLQQVAMEFEEIEEGINNN